MGDRRVEKVGEHEYKVVSSDGSRTYRVVVKNVDERTFIAYSDDNGTIHRGYVGYPIIAVLMMNNVIPVDRDIMEALKGIPWKELNTKYKNYSIVENIVLEQCEKRGVKRSIVSDYVNIVFKKLNLIKIYFDENLSKQ